MLIYIDTMPRAFERRYWFFAIDASPLYADACCFASHTRALASCYAAKIYAMFMPLSVTLRVDTLLDMPRYIKIRLPLFLMPWLLR